VKKLTITVDNDVYRGLKKKVGPRRISRFLNDLARPHVVDDDLLAAYRQMSEDRAREDEAQDWIEALIEDAAPQPE
jgi:predicted CopG family antitoxin